MPPKAAFAASAIATTSASSRTSALTAKALPPAASIAATTSPAFSPEDAILPGAAQRVLLQAVHQALIPVYAADVESYNFV